MRANPYLECPRCETDTLIVIGSDVTEQNVGLRRYRCDECRNTFSTVESFFTDDEGNEDCFLQLAMNVRLRDREAHQRRTGKKPRRQLKPSDRLATVYMPGRVMLTYVRTPRAKAVFLECKRGHRLEGDNVRINTTTGNRYCVTCNRASQYEWWLRHKAQRDEGAA